MEEYKFKLNLGLISSTSEIILEQQKTIFENGLGKPLEPRRLSRFFVGV
ncbi:MAG TPA: hypothetical protein GX708_17895 [Gallicola sp.]|nr:hypothetical protein [Gallicola sp.]